MQTHIPINTQIEHVYDKILFQILQKPHWQQKLGDEGVLEKYRKELREGIEYNDLPGVNEELLDLEDGEDQSQAEDGDDDGDTKHFRWDKPALKEIVNVAIKDAQNLAGMMKAEKAVWTLANPNVAIADLIVPRNLKDALLVEVARLEGTNPDYHPGTNDMVVDIVHPSLFCAVSGKTVFRNGDGVLEVFRSPSPHGIFDDYQWLPTDFEILNDALLKDKQIPLGCRKNSYYDNNHEQIVYPIFNPSYSPFPKTIYKLSSNIQVIVKIASIELTPEKPRYNGGSWHLEGTDSESIIAAGIYYFQSQNITESKLSFRSVVEEPDYEQSDDLGVMEVFGIGNEDELVRYLGALGCQEDRLLVFKNYRQHKVEEFELVDQSERGCRKILAFFLVDDSKKVLSTGQVPFGNLHLMVEFMQVLFRNKLPVEILEVIAGYSGAIKIKEARENRDKLIEARKTKNDSINEDIIFSLCEH